MCASPTTMPVKQLLTSLARRVRPTPKPSHGTPATGAHAQGGHDVFAHELPLPPLPPRAAYAPAGVPPHAPRAPALDDAALAGLAPKQAARLRSEHSAASELDEQLRQARPAMGTPCGAAGRATDVGAGVCGVDMHKASGLDTGLA